MTASIVVFTEEPSARIVIDSIAKSVVTSKVQVLEHAGKSDLEKSISRKINGWRSPERPRFIITRDLDSGSLELVKEKLFELVPSYAHSRTKVRIVVPELETWYLGDPNALEEVGLVTRAVSLRLQSGARFRNLCLLHGAKAEFKKVVGNIGQIAAAQLIAPAMRVERNRSANFQAFVGALRWADMFTAVGHDNA